MDYKIEIVLEKNDDFAEFLSEQLREFNNKHSFHHREARKEGATQPIHIIVSDENNQPVGGISAEVYWNWLEIHKFWFSEPFRGKGIGSSLLKKTEEIAIEKGATKVLLTTFDYQGHTFYKKHGYHVVGAIQDYPPGSTFYTMVKSLV